MGVLDRIRRLTSEQQALLRAIDHEEQNAVALENLEAERIAAEEAYLRRRDRLLGREVADVYAEIETARSSLASAVRARQARFEEVRLRVLAGGSRDPAPPPSQLELLPPGA